MVGNVNKVGVREVTHFGEGGVITTTAVVFKDQAFHRFRVATWPTNAPVNDTQYLHMMMPKTTSCLKS